MVPWTARGSRLRATVHLHDAETRESLFAENYDHDISDVFEMQDEIVRTIVGAIEPELLRHERERIVRTPLQDASAYELLQRGQWHHYRYTKQDNQQAQDYFRHALSVAPAYCPRIGSARAGTWDTRRLSAGQAMSGKPISAMRCCIRATRCRPIRVIRWRNLRWATTYLHTVSPEEAAGRLREATQLDPSYAAAHANLSLVYNFMNRPEAALPEIELALRLSPHDPRKFQWLAVPRDQPLPERALPPGTGGREEALSALPDYPVALRYCSRRWASLAVRRASCDPSGFDLRRHAPAAQMRPLAAHLHVRQVLFAAHISKQSRASTPWITVIRTLFHVAE